MKAISKIKERFLSNWISLTGPIFINGIGKLLGFVREVLISSMFGVSAMTDAFFAIQQLLVFISSYIGGAFNLAFIPAYIRNMKLGTPKEFLFPVVLVVTCLGMMLTIIPFIAPDGMIDKIFGFDKKANFVNEFAKILAIAVLPSILIGLAYGVLHAERSHRAATLLGTISSSGMLIVLLGFYWVPVNGYALILSLPISYLVGSLLAGGVSLSIVLKRTAGKLDRKKADFKGFIGALGASSVENIGFNLNQYSNVYYAIKMGEGLVSINAFAMRIGFLPLALISSQLGQIYQSWAGGIVADGRVPPRKVYFSIVAVSLIVSIGMMLLSSEIVRLIYERGSFTSEHSKDVANLLVPYACYFFVMSVNQTAARHYFVISKAKTYSAVMVGAYVVAVLFKSKFSVVIEDIIWCCIAAEGFAAVYFSAQIAMAKPK